MLRTQFSIFLTLVLSRLQWQAHGFWLVNEHALWVAPSKGSDGFNGSKTYPFKTIERALDSVAAHRCSSTKNSSSNLKASSFSHAFKSIDPISINIIGDVYQVSKPIILNKCHQNIQINGIVNPDPNSNHQFPIISGGIQLAGQWYLLHNNSNSNSNYPNSNIWYLNLTNMNLNHTFLQLFGNNQRCMRARDPNWGSFYHMKNTLPSIYDQSIGFVYSTYELSNSYITLLNKTITNPNTKNEIELIIYDSWMTSRRLLTNINFNNTNNTFWLNNDARIEIEPFANSGSRYYIENSFQFLDKPNEWYFNHQSQILYYIPPTNTSNPNNMTFIVPRIKNDLFIINNSYNIEINNISFSFVDYNQNQALIESGGVQAASFLNYSTVHVYNSSNIIFNSIEISHCAAYGLWIEYNCSNITLESSLINDLGAGGVRIGRGKPLNDVFPISARSNSIQIKNNVICNGGAIFSEGNGILLQHVSNNLITHNTVCFFNHVGISIGWEWDYLNSTLCSNNNNISYNLVTNLGNGQLSDLGGIYTLGNSTGTVIEYNKIHDIYPYYTYGHGIYLDQASSNINVTKNIVYSTEAAAFYQHFGAWNLVFNNIFAMANGGNFGQLWEAQLQYSQFGPSNLTFYKNIVVVNESLWYMFESPFNGTWFSDFNLYWNYSSINGSLSNTFPNVCWSKETKNNYDIPINGSFQQWQDCANNDLNSIMSDPLFANINNFNFTMDNNSPAFELLQFENIGNLDGVGASIAHLDFDNWPWELSCNTKCSEPPNPPHNGSYVSGIAHYECASYIVYHCKNGFILQGDAFRQCNSQGQWSGSEQPASCVAYQDL